MIKLNTLLAKVEHGTSTFNRMIGDYAVFFKNKQGMFEGSNPSLLTILCKNYICQQLLVCKDR